MAKTNFSHACLSPDHHTYFPHIDGLRTFAVLSVILYHLEECICPGGYTGVDIFFVISGYLIGGGLIHSLKQQTFSFSSFYYRRIRRIMPAYFCLISVVMVVGCLILDCDDLRTMGRTIRSSALFITNTYFSRTAGDYFSPTAEENSLLNLWSLSVEEQFYLIIPITLWLLWKLRQKITLPVLWGILILSFFSTVYYMGHGENNKAFYLILCRSWELLAGCLLAFIPLHTGQSKNLIWLRLAGWAGILLPFICYTSATRFPGFTAIPTIVGSALLIRYGNHGWTGLILKHPISIGIGKISYSLYLWHWPIIVYWTYICFNNCNIWDYVGMFLLSFLLGFLSWKFVETPFRTNASWFKPWKAFTATALGCLTLGFSGEWLKQTNGARDYFHVTVNQMEFPEYWQGPAFPPSFGIVPPSGAIVEKGNLIQPHHPTLGDVTDYPFVLLGNPEQQPSFLLIGDSHAMASSPGFDATAQTLQKAGLFYRARLCPLSGISDFEDSDSLTLLRQMYPHWEHNMGLILNWLENTPQIHTVFIHNRWIELVNTNRSTSFKKLIATGLMKTCTRLHQAGKQIVLLGPVPEWTFGPRKLTRRNALLHTQHTDRLLGSEFTIRQRPVFDLLNQMESSKICRCVLLHQIFQQNGRWITKDNGQYLYCDDNHLSPYGSKKMIDSVISQLFLTETEK